MRGACSSPTSSAASGRATIAAAVPARSHAAAAEVVLRVGVDALRHDTGLAVEKKRSRHAVISDPTATTTWTTGSRSSPTTTWQPGSASMALSPRAVARRSSTYGIVIPMAPSRPYRDLRYLYRGQPIALHRFDHSRAPGLLIPLASDTARPLGNPLAIVQDQVRNTLVRASADTSVPNQARLLGLGSRTCFIGSHTRPERHRHTRAASARFQPRSPAHEHHVQLIKPISVKGP
jgi:hypothetical protein